MLRLSAVVLLLCFITAGLHAGEPLYVPHGADKAGMAFASVASPDHWGSFQNQALMPFCARYSAGISFESKFMVAEMSHKAFSVIIQGKPAPIGFIASHFGNGQYSVIFTGAGSAARLSDNITIGVQADYLYQKGIGDYTDISHITFEAGLAVQITSEIFAGIHVFNPLATLNTLPATLRTGIAWSPLSDINLSVEASKTSCEPLCLHGGLCWTLKEKLALRTGYMSSPSSLAFGIGFISGSLRTDLGFLYNNNTGLTSSISVTIEVN